MIPMASIIFVRGSSFFQIAFMGVFSTTLIFAMETPRLPANAVEWSMILLGQEEEMHLNYWEVFW